MIKSFKYIGKNERKIHEVKITLNGFDEEYTYGFIVQNNEVFLSNYVWKEGRKIAIGLFDVEGFITSMILHIKKLDFVRIRHLYEPYTFQIAPKRVR